MFDLLREVGLFTIPFPQEYGGTGSMLSAALAVARPSVARSTHRGSVAAPVRSTRLCRCARHSTPAWPLP